MSDDLETEGATDRFVSHPGGTEKRKLPKRFYKLVSVTPVDGGFSIELDGRSVKTPARETLSVPSRALADALAAEWEAQDSEIDPEAMLLTKLANTALDRVAPRREGIVDEISAFGASDLVCYRAEGPEGLVTRQAEEWDPLLSWLESELGPRLEVTSGVIFKEQPDEALAYLRASVGTRSDFELSGLHLIVTLTGSLVLGLAVIEAYLDAEAAHRLAHIDETWQADQWGADEEADIRLEGRRQALVAAARYLELLSSATS